ncbi:MAG: FliM/FliN family flagellar motor switch protein, partial [Opitutales bacterium]
WFSRRCFNNILHKILRNLGSQIQLKQNAKDPVSLLVNGKLIALGEVVVIDDRFGLKITEIVDSIS